MTVTLEIESATDVLLLHISTVTGALWNVSVTECVNEVLVRYGSLTRHITVAVPIGTVTSWFVMFVPLGIRQEV